MVLTGSFFTKCSVKYTMDAAVCNLVDRLVEEKLKGVSVSITCSIGTGSESALTVLPLSDHCFEGTLLPSGSIDLLSLFRDQALQLSVVFSQQQLQQAQQKEEEYQQECKGDDACQADVWDGESAQHLQGDGNERGSYDRDSAGESECMGTKEENKDDVYSDISEEQESDTDSQNSTDADADAAAADDDDEEDGDDDGDASDDDRW